MMDLIPYYELATADGDLLKLNLGTVPDNVFKEIKKRITGYGGTWKTNKKGFVFKTDRAQEVLDELMLNKAENVFKTHQFFYTTKTAWDRANDLIPIQLYNDDHILEPSCGDGAMVGYIQELIKEEDLLGTKIDVCEIADFNREIVKRKGLNLVGDDFLRYNPGPIYDVIIANPPFNKGQDIKHVMHMWDLLKDGGNIYTFTGGNVMEDKQFSHWLKHEVTHFDHHKVEAKYFRPNKSNADTIFFTLHKTS